MQIARRKNKKGFVVNIKKKWKFPDEI